MDYKSLSVKDLDEFHRQARELAEAAEWEGCELGEWWSVLPQMFDAIMRSDQADAELKNAMLSQLKTDYEWFVDNCHWVEEEYQPKPKKVKRLVFNDES